MKIKSLLYPLLLLLLLTPACTKPPIMLDTVFVLNATEGTVTEVTVLHEPTKSFGKVNAILSGMALEIGLASGGQPLLAKRALIHWRDADGQEWSVTLDIPYESSIAKGDQRVGLKYVIYSSGRATVQFKE